MSFYRLRAFFESPAAFGGFRPASGSGGPSFCTTTSLQAQRAINSQPRPREISRTALGGLPVASGAAGAGTTKPTKTIPAGGLPPPQTPRFILGSPLPRPRKKDQDGKCNPYWGQSVPDPWLNCSEIFDFRPFRFEVGLGTYPDRQNLSCCSGCTKDLARTHFAIPVSFTDLLGSLYLGILQG